MTSPHEGWPFLGPGWQPAFTDVWGEPVCWTSMTSAWGLWPRHPEWLRAHPHHIASAMSLGCFLLSKTPYSCGPLPSFVRRGGSAGLGGRGASAPSPCSHICSGSTCPSPLCVSVLSPGLGPATGKHPTASPTALPAACCPGLFSRAPFRPAQAREPPRASPLTTSHPALSLQPHRISWSCSTLSGSLIPPLQP